MPGRSRTTSEYYRIPGAEHGYSHPKFFTDKLRRGGTPFDALLRFARARLR